MPQIHNPTIPTIILLLLLYSLGHDVTSNVVRIADGDTITILDSSKKQHKIGLYGIDTTEKKQAFGKAAKKHTSKLTNRKVVTVKTYDTDMSLLIHEPDLLTFGNQWTHSLVHTQ